MLSSRQFDVEYREKRYERRIQRQKPSKIKRQNMNTMKSSIALIQEVVWVVRVLFSRNRFLGVS
jgi:hypothetical protein